VWWSNDTCYLPKPYSYKSSVDNKWYSSKPLDFLTKDKEIKFYECRVCELSVGEDELYESGMGDDYCPQCGSCYQCDAYVSEDLCYKGSNSDAKWWIKQGGAWDW
jgi:hypothetical protein